MDIYKTHYFKLPVTLQKLVGLWPYDSWIRRVVLRATCFTGTAAMAIPQILGLIKYFHKDVDKTLHHISVLMFVIMVFMKLFTSIIAEQKLKSLYDDIQTNFYTLKDKDERRIIYDHLEYGKFMAVGYSAYMYGGYVFFVALPLLPKLLNQLLPLNESRPLLYMLDGEFVVDRSEHYYKIFSFDVVTGSIVITVVVSVDIMYTSCSEQCVALFSIIKFRLLKIGDEIDENEDYGYNYLILTIQMHQRVLSFAKVVASTYEFSFLILTGINLIYFSTLSVLLLINFHVPMNLIRFALLLVFLAVHLFFLSWPGQKFINLSTDLFSNGYCSKWYQCSRKTKRLLEILFIRCLTPCTITAGGLYCMNFENYLKVMKSSISYITVFASFR